MNNLAYSTQDPDKVAPKIEEILRKDLNSSSPLLYTIQKESETGTNVSTILSDVSKGIFGGKTVPIFSLSFDINQQRPIQIMIDVCRQGIGCYVGSLVFYTRINKPISGAVSLEAPKMFGSSKFTGDDDASAKLNKNGDLIKLAGKFSRVKSDVGNTKLDRYFKVEPADGGTQLVVVTLPRATSMGMSATTDAADFISIASMIEQAL